MTTKTAKGIEIFDFKIDRITDADRTLRAVNAYIKIDGMKGASKAAGLEGYSNVEAWSHSFSQPAQLHRTDAGGISVTDTTHGDVVVVKQIDTMTIDLLKKCWTGDTIASLEIAIVARDSGKYFQCELTNIIVTEHTVMDIPGTPGTLEKLKFNYDTVKYTFIPKDQAQADQGNMVVQYDKSREITS